MDSVIGVATDLRRTVKQVADELNCSPDTVRRYANEFSLYLSAAASPERGTARSFDERDIAMLKNAREQMSSGKNFDQVRAVLSMMDFNEPGTTIPAESVAEPEDDALPAMYEVTSSMLTLVDAVAATQAQLAALPEMNQRLGVIAEAMQIQVTMQTQIDTLSQDVNDLTIRNVQLREDLQGMRKQGLTYFIWFLVGSGVAVAALAAVIYVMNAGLLPL